jgi:hypothetical protein
MPKITKSLIQQHTVWQRLWLNALYKHHFLFIGIRDLAEVHEMEEVTRNL